MFKDKTILITGGTGSWGHELTRKLLVFQPKEIRIFSRNEYAQVRMKRTFNNHPSLKFVIGDVRDFEAINEACKQVDYVFHLAALKHVPICEEYPQEALKTNVTGTENIIKASIMQKVKKVIDVSSDKAVDPVNLYGMSKAVGEKLMIRANQLSEDTRFVCIRGGNVLGTNGSVVPLFKKQILDSGSVSITDSSMTRFFLTVSEAIDLLLQASAAAVGGETFVMKMKACRITDLADALGDYLLKKPIKHKEIGIRPGEKLHEVLVSHAESPYTHQFNDQYYVILPSHAPSHLYSHYTSMPKVSFNKYESDGDLMSHEDIIDLLKKGGMLD
ncbi:polysaccharide biosynthesis protein [Bacillus massiliglaciei]|uniref:polysaccharide biosynthesis protein n=1 Tax=Bacillus massiliglaciei TaxID=1816693 RepID=UPI000A8AC7F7|nr:polysaccharide biosynthesis protein [Bacillus massiliglaciei]